MIITWDYNICNTYNKELISIMFKKFPQGDFLIENWQKLTEEEIKKANHHMKRCSTLVVFRKCSFKTMRCRFLPMIRAKV